MPTHHLLADDPASQAMGVDVVAVGDGTATLRMTVKPEMANGFGICHGGMIFAFADTCFAFSCNPADAPEDNTIAVAAQADIDFLRPARVGDVLTASGEPRHRGRGSGIWDVRVSNPDGETIAEFRGRSRTILKRHSS